MNDVFNVDYPKIVTGFQSTVMSKVVGMSVKAFCLDKKSVSRWVIY